MTTYQEVLDYLYHCLPMFQKTGKTAFKANLNNIVTLCNHLCQPQNKFPSIHIAGTNGKGSSAHLLSAILQESGYKVGLYTSPHLKSFTERIKVDGQEMTKEAVVHFVTRHQSLIEKLQPSFFEITVAMAFSYFATKKVDIAVIETGLGGRLDSTNVISPILSLITNIGYDHQDILGDTLEKIAKEKAGIIKPDTPVVISETHPETKPVFLEVSKSLGAPIHFTETYQIQRLQPSSSFLTVSRNQEVLFEKIQPALQGNCQLKNIAGVLQSVEILRQKDWNISTNSIRKGIENTTTITGFKGRWQILGTEPLTICDTAHNVEGIKWTVQQLLETPHQNLHIVLGLTKEKEIRKILNLYPMNAFYYFCQYSAPRTLEASALRKEAEISGLKGDTFCSVNEAMQAASQKASQNDLIFVGGSTFVVADIENL